MTKFGGFGGGGMGNLQQMMKHAQKMQGEMKKAQDELEETEVTGSAGGELVTVTLNGKKAFLNITIKPEAVDPDDVEMLEDLIRAAMNDAQTAADKLYQEKMGPFAHVGLGL